MERSLIRTGGMELIYQGTDVKPCSLIYGALLKRRNNENADYFSQGRVKPGEENDFPNGYRFWIYFFEKNSKSGVITIIEDGWAGENATTESIYYKGPKNILKDLKKIITSENNLEKEVNKK